MTNRTFRLPHHVLEKAFGILFELRSEVLEVLAHADFYGLRFYRLRRVSLA